MGLTVGQLSLTHLVRRPAERNQASPPSVILLHGVGSNERDLFGLAPELDPRLFIVSARGPLTRSPGSYAWFPVQFTPTGFLIDEDEAENSRLLVLRFTGEIVAEYGLDPRRVFLMGFSQGCIMSLYAALTEPERFRGVVGMSGRLLPQAVTKMAPADRLRGFPILVVHGTEDTTIGIDYGRSIREQLGKLPVDLEYREYPMGHWVSSASLAHAKAWLTRHVDATQP
ncbi:MAG TPA: alpha/beta fold hydrolase [Bryobacteraceae bacterium]|nr:alpha/beta fold hydrolase [Bryobacteraceae bacterium]